jgi:hypothetical protein
MRLCSIQNIFKSRLLRPNGAIPGIRVATEWINDERYPLITELDAYQDRLYPPESRHYLDLASLKLALYIFFVLGTTNPTAAQVGPNHEGGNNGYRYLCSSGAPRTAIVACTRIIDDKREDSDSHAMALQNRGYDEVTARQLDQRA